MDNCTIAKDQFDYARVLLATSSLDVINFTEKILIDGEIVELKIIEEWGFEIGEDACSLEDVDDDSKVSVPCNNYDFLAPDVCDQVDDLVNNLADDWVDEGKEIQCKSSPKAT